MPEKSEMKQKITPSTAFKPGQSGNPKGKPKGALNHATRTVLALLDGESEALTRKAVEKALEGDCVALRLCLERLCPPRKDSPVILAGLPKIETAVDIPRVTARILEVVAEGTITPSEGQAVAGLVEYHRKAIELAEIEQRLSALEAKENSK